MLVTLYQNKYNLALKKRKKQVMINSTIGVIATGLFAGLGYFNVHIMLSAGVGIAIFSPILLDCLFVPELEPLTFFPLVKLNDKVIYNPLTKYGRKYKVSYDHAMINEKIPTWEVVAVGENSFVIKQGDELKELDFSRQKDILIINNRNSVPKPLSLTHSDLTIQDGLYLPPGDFSDDQRFITPNQVGTMGNQALSGTSMEDELL